MKQSNINRTNGLALRWITFPLLAATVVINSCSGGGSLSQEAISKFIDAKSAYEQGNLESSLISFQEIAGGFPQFREAFLMAGKSAFFLGRYPDAENILRLTGKRFPDYQEAGFWLAMSLVRQSRKDEAFLVFRELLRNNPQDFRILHQLGIISLEKNDLLLSMDYFRRGLLAKEELALLALSLGRLYYSQGLLTEAEEILSDNIVLTEKDSPIRTAFDSVLAIIIEARNSGVQSDE